MLLFVTIVIVIVKIQKYGTTAKLNSLIFIAGIFSHAGEMDVVIKNLFLQQIKFKLQLVDGEVKKSKVRAIMKHCVCNISAAINRSASRNILLKAQGYQNGQLGNPCPTKLILPTSSSSSVSPDVDFTLAIASAKFFYKNSI